MGLTSNWEITDTDDISRWDQRKNVQITNKIVSSNAGFVYGSAAILVIMFVSNFKTAVTLNVCRSTNFIQMESISHVIPSLMYNTLNTGVNYYQFHREWLVLISC
jgi:hypothetical protein